MMSNIDQRDLCMGLRLLKALSSNNDSVNINNIVKERYNKTKKLDYEFSSDFLKNPTKLVQYLKSNDLKYKVTTSGIMVRCISKKQINEARKIANKKSQSYELQFK